MKTILIGLVMLFSFTTFANVDNPTPVAPALNCGGAIVVGTVNVNEAVSSVMVSVPYSNGDKSAYSAQTVGSTGVTGLTASRSAGNFSYGSCFLDYVISGTPTNGGTANFAITAGGSSCSFSISITGPVHCGGGYTTVTDVTNPETGKIWMDRNLGASRVATSSTDSEAYGDLYQWGRGADAHQCRNSGTTSTPSSGDVPGNNNFITGSLDWRSALNDNLWQGVSGANNPCPTGYRLPTQSELDAERLSWASNNSIGAFASVLKMTNAGFRSDANGNLANTDTYGYYWSSTVSGNNVSLLEFQSGGAGMSSLNRAYGYSVRCIKNTDALQGSISSIDCSGASNSGTLTNTVAASGVSSEIPYSGGNGGVYSSQSISSTGVTGLTARLTAGFLASGSGTLTYNITGTPSGTGTASFTLTIGGQSCTLTRNVVPLQGIITLFSCGSASNSGTVAFDAISGASSSVPYIGGNGGVYSAQTIISTGVTGLTASLSAGTLMNGSGSLLYTITGTPSGAGTASFALSIGGQSCTLTRTVDNYRSGTVHCGGVAAAVQTVLNSKTNKYWMDRNLGASRVAIVFNDASAYGDLYQWGRRADGHQCRNSATTSSLSSSNQPAHGNFIVTSSGNYDWRSPQNNNLWQGVSGTNNPCPAGFRLPTIAELESERLSWGANNLTGAYNSALKLPSAGFRDFANGGLASAGQMGVYWSSTIGTAGSSPFSTYLQMLSSNAVAANASPPAINRAYGASVRCIKN